MFKSSTLKFLKDIKKNNNRPWMEANRSAYLDAKEDFENFTAQIIDKLGKIDTDIAGLEVKNCTFRLNRDVRFSKDKSPYKNNFGAVFAKGGKKSIYGGYYFQLDAEKSFLCGGCWMPEATNLKKIRQEIDYNLDDFSKILQNKKFVNRFGGFEKDADAVLSRPPKGYEAENPAIEYLKRKSFVALRYLEDSLLTDKQLIKQTVNDFEVLLPLINFINQSLI